LAPLKPIEVLYPGLSIGAAFLVPRQCHSSLQSNVAPGVVTFGLPLLGGQLIVPIIEKTTVSHFTQ